MFCMLIHFKTRIRIKTGNKIKKRENTEKTNKQQNINI